MVMGGEGNDILGKTCAFLGGLCMDGLFFLRLQSGVHLPERGGREHTPGEA